MFGEFRKSHAHGHEANELEAFMASIQHRELERIKYFYHVTTPENAHRILCDGKLLPNVTELPHWTKLSRDHNSPSGVWFSVSLLHNELPETSTYGESRIKIPCQQLISNMHTPRLYLESFYYFGFRPKNQIVRLILVDAEKRRDEDEWCSRECLRRVNMADNKILVLNHEKHEYKAIANNDEFPNISIEVLVVGPVEIVAIDAVGETSPSRQEAIPGKLPPLI